MSNVKLGLVVQGDDLFAVQADEETGVVEASQYLCQVTSIDNMIEALEQVKAACEQRQEKPAGVVLH